MPTLTPQSALFSAQQITIITAAISAIVVIIGWYIAHLFSLRLDRKARKKEILTKYRIEAYRSLTHDINDREDTRERIKSIENLISDIQLFGTKEQIAMTRKLAETIQKQETFGLDPLIDEMRGELRKELELQPVEGTIFYLRIRP